MPAEAGNAFEFSSLGMLDPACPRPPRTRLARLHPRRKRRSGVLANHRRRDAPGEPEASSPPIVERHEPAPWTPAERGILEANVEKVRRLAAFRREDPAA